MLVSKSRKNYNRKNHTKIVDGKRMLALDGGTSEVLRYGKNEKHNTEIWISISPMMAYPWLINYCTNYCSLCEACSVPVIQAKGLRNSHVSFLFNELNASVLVVLKLLGNSSPEITLKHYAHLLRRIDDDVAESMTGIIKIETATSKQFTFVGNQAVK